MKKIIICTAVLCTGILGLKSITTFAGEQNNIGTEISSSEEALQILKEFNEEVKNTNDVNNKEEIRSQAKSIIGDFMQDEYEKDSTLYQDENIKEILNEIDKIEMEVSAFNEKGAGSENTKATRSAWSQRRGNILISLSASTYGFQHGHAAILSDKEGMVIEALPKPGVIQQSASKYWSTVNDEREFYVDKATWANYDGAIKYAKNQIGEPYKIKTTLSNTSEWYCSKLVYKAFDSQGIDIGPPGLVKPLIILPANIYWNDSVMWYATNPI